MKKENEQLTFEQIEQYKTKLADMLCELKCTDEPGNIPKLHERGVSPYDYPSDVPMELLPHAIKTLSVEKDMLSLMGRENYLATLPAAEKLIIYKLALERTIEKFSPEKGVLSWNRLRVYFNREVQGIAQSYISLPAGTRKRLESLSSPKPAKTKEKKPAPYTKVRDCYLEICISFPKITAMSEARKKAITARFNSGYSIDDFKKLFAKAEASDFLKGANEKNWRATFDWLIADKNMAKVLDGNYDNNSISLTQKPGYSTKGRNAIVTGPAPQKDILGDAEYKPLKGKVSNE